MRLNYRILALSLAITPVAAAAQQAPPKFDAYVRRVMETFTVPGGGPRRIAFSERGSIGAIASMAGYLTFVR